MRATQVTKRLAVSGALLLVVGVAGLASLVVLGGCGLDVSATARRAEAVPQDVGPHAWHGTRPGGRLSVPRVAPLGERIYVLGVGEDGSAVPRTAVGPGMMSRVACGDCHGADGSGSTFRMMMQVVAAPDIRYGSLTASHDEHGDGAEVWTDADIRRAVEEGVEPDGETLDPAMPRWRFTEREFDALLDYLKELSE